MCSYSWIICKLGVQSDGMLYPNGSTFQIFWISYNRKPHEHLHVELEPGRRVHFFYIYWIITFLFVFMYYNFVNWNAHLETQVC